MSMHMGFWLENVKCWLALNRATSMLIGQSIYDAINIIKRLQLAHDSQSELRPGPDHHSGFDIEILK